MPTSPTPLHRGVQLGALPWRDGPSGREVLLITTRGGRQWLVPKGKPMRGFTPAQAAAEEAWEEAGVRGEIADEPIGAFSHRKGSVFAGRRLQVDLYPLKVEREADDWPEAHERQRRWVSIPAALLGTFIGNPLSWPAIWSASYVAGVWVLGDDPADAAEHFVQSANKLSATLMAPSRSLDSAVVSLSPIIEPLVIGGLLVGLIAAVFSYYPTRQAVRVFQKRRRAR